MRIGRKFLGALAFCFSIGAPALAQDAEQAIERAARVYGIEALEDASTIRLESEIRLPFGSHDYSSEFHDLSQQRFHIVLDVENQQGSHEFLTQIAQTSYHGRNFLKDGKVTFVAYGPDTHQDQGEADFFTEFGGAFRSSDVLLAMWMKRTKSEAKYLGEVVWLGDAHDIVEVEFPSSPPLRVFVRLRDGAITKMERTLPDERRVFYTFYSHEESANGLIAREHSFYVEAERVYFAFNNRMVLDDSQDEQAFELDDDIVLEPERTDQTEMAIRNVGINKGPQQSIHQVGQGENCTTFMVVGDAVVGFGMSQGFGQRLDMYREQTKITLPLRYVIAADHHDEDIGGAAEATEAGATLLVTDHTATKLRATEIDHDLEVVDQTRRIGDLTVLSLATDHAATILAAYHETQKTVIQTGHYYSSFIEGPSYARQTAVTFYEALPSAIRSEAKAILSGQDMKREKWSDFVSAVEAHEPVWCHRGRPICGP